MKINTHINSQHIYGWVVLGGLILSPGVENIIIESNMDFKKQMHLNIIHEGP